MRETNTDRYIQADLKKSESLIGTYNSQVKKAWNEDRKRKAG
jgi:hypothetical protein